MFRIIFFSQGRTLKKTAWDQASKVYFVFSSTSVMVHQLLYAKELYLSRYSYLSRRKIRPILCYIYDFSVLLAYYVPYTYINNNTTFATAQDCNIIKYFYTDRTINGSIFFSRTSAIKNPKYILQFYEHINWFWWSVSAANQLLHWLSLYLPGKFKWIPICTLSSSDV